MNRRERLAAGLVGCLTLLAIGWTGLLIPSLIRSIEAAFEQTDAGIGALYLAYALAYAAGSFGGGPLTERVGRRPVLGGAVLVAGLGNAGLGLAPTWATFVLAALTAGAGAGCLDGGANGLVLDVYREGRGRAMNLLHMSFSVGALAAPLVMGALVQAAIPWQTVAVGTGAVVALLATAYVVVPMPSGKRSGSGEGERTLAGADELGFADAGERGLPAAGEGGLAGAGERRLAGADERGLAGADQRGLAAAGDPDRRPLFGGPLLLLGIAIAAYVASEVGVSNWLVRFLEPAPLTTATLALSLYWAGLAVGRLVSSAVADRFDHLRFTIACALAMAALIAVAVLVPVLPLSIAAFAAAGVASGPVFPMIVAIGGERYPERSAAVGGLLTGMAVVGSMIYPPAIGFMSVTVGLAVAMFGNAIVAIGCALALVAFSRAIRRRA